MPSISSISREPPIKLGRPRGWRAYLRVLKNAALEWNSDNALRLGAALSYYTVFSLGPLLLVSIGIAGLCFGDQAARGQLSGQMQQLIGADGAKAVEAMVANARTPSSGIIATIVGVVVLLIGATGVFTELKSDLNEIWHCPASTVSFWRGLVKDRLLSFAMILSIGFLLLVSLVLSALISAVGQYFSGLLPASPAFLQLISSGVSFLLITVLFALIFKILPDVQLKWKDVWVGAAITSALFTVGKFLIGLYLGHSAIASSYGASASLVIVMLWTYYSSLILFLGVEITKIYAHELGSMTHLEMKKNATS